MKKKILPVIICNFKIILIIMFYNLYQLWQVYRIILHLHGFYVAYSFVCWTLSESLYYFNFMISLFYIIDPNEIKQLEDKKILDEID